MFLQTCFLHKGKANTLLKALLFLFILGAAASCGETKDPYRSVCRPTDEEKDAQKIADIKNIKKYFRDNNIDTTNMQVTASGIHYFVLTPGTGAQVQQGNLVSLHYVGKTLDGHIFDNSYPRAQTLNVVIGTSSTTIYESGRQVIAGWHEALQLMKVGEETRFYIPSYLAYGPCGDQQTGAIPPNAVLAFDMKVLSAR